MKFEIHKSNAKEPYRVKIVSSNGQTLAMTENFASKSSARNAAESIKKGAGARTSRMSPTSSADVTCPTPILIGTSRFVPYAAATRPGAVPGLEPSRCCSLGRAAHPARHGRRLSDVRPTDQPHIEWAPTARFGLQHQIPSRHGY